MLVDQASPNVVDQQRGGSRLVAGNEPAQMAAGTEDNVAGAPGKGGVAGPSGPVDKVLETVVNNLLITNDLDIQPEIRCRVLLTSPLSRYHRPHHRDQPGSAGCAAGRGLAGDGAEP